MCLYYHLNLITNPAATIYGILFLVIGILAIIGNVISGIILWKPAMKDKSNGFLKSLVIADAFVGIFCCPLYVHQLITKTFLSTSIVYEEVRNYLNVWLSSTSALTIVLIAADRYLLLTKLTNYSTYMNDRRMAVLIAFAWLYPLMAVSMCFVNDFVYRYTYIVSTICSTAALCTFYILTLKNISRKRKRFQSVRSVSTTSINHVSRQEKRQQLQLTKNVSFLVACYIVCSVPSLITAVVRSIYQPNAITSSALQQAYLFAYFSGSANSCINPMVYAAKFPEFRYHLKKMFGCNKPKNNSSINLESTGKKT